MQFFTVKRRNTVKGREKQPLVKSMLYQMHYLAFVLSDFGCHSFPHISHILNAFKIYYIYLI